MKKEHRCCQTNRFSCYSTNPVTTKWRRSVVEFGLPQHQGNKIPSHICSSFCWRDILIEEYNITCAKETDSVFDIQHLPMPFFYLCCTVAKVPAEVQLNSHCWQYDTSDNSAGLWHVLVLASTRAFLSNILWHPYIVWQEVRCVFVCVCVFWDCGVLLSYSLTEVLILVLMIQTRNRNKNQRTGYKKQCSDWYPNGPDLFILCRKFCIIWKCGRHHWYR